MPRAPTTAEVFNAIAEPRRRAIIDMLARGDVHCVGDLVVTLHVPQPAESKHPAVLRQVGLVSARRRGRERLYWLGEIIALHRDGMPEGRAHGLAAVRDAAQRRANDRRK